MTARLASATVAERLEVHLYGAHVADVIDGGMGETAVQYTAAARRIGGAARLSLSLPVREALYPSLGHGTRWVRSLLPEGRALAHAVQTYEVPEDDRFALLSVLGRDVAGALVIVPPGQPVVDGRAAYEPLLPRDLAELAARAHDIPLGIDEERNVRLSLAGLQDKLLLHRPTRSRRYYRPTFGAPSTVIVKPEPAPSLGRHLDGVATNEVFCLTLARRCGLPTASARVERFGDVDCAVIDRYDRSYRAGGEVDRIHQEDLLAAMGRDPLLKYEGSNEGHAPAQGGFAELQPVRRNPGPGLDDLAALLEQHLGRAALLMLADIAAFNVAIGNADAHARNLSVLLRPDGGVALAPLYDLVATRAFAHLTTAAAQFVNGKLDIDAITIDDIVAHAERWQLPVDLVQRRVRGLLSRVKIQLPKAAGDVIQAGGRADVAEGLVELIGSRVLLMVP